MRIASLIVVVTLLVACEPERPQVVMYPVASRDTRVEVHPETRIVVPPGSPQPVVLAPGEWPMETRGGSSEIVVTTSTKLDRPTEVVGVIDTHEPSGRQDAAFALLRQRAAAMGADAVVGVEFHHGDEKGEPTHLSGLAVRFTR